ncbi:uncharacterized protein LOC108915711 [Anoplophora glabripennis]|uniref:uncharacterized protein LOC108915711 n=1 Tax=Anoplophora glabripennis TaxID=217634 RepID=UPI0008745EE8|nr:uncharacterized protein LOC108915711 [Anoplophora glabripennis]
MVKEPTVAMEAKKKHRKVLRASFTKVANELDTLLQVDKPVHCDVEISWECLKGKFDELHAWENQVYEALLESATEEQLMSEMDSSDAYQRRFTELRLRCNKVLLPGHATAEVDDMFRKVHEDPDIDSSDKIEYLIQATVPGSRARQLVESFPVVGENYGKIVECMQARFGRDDLQIEVHVRELLKLILGNTRSSQKSDISKLYDEIETQLRALETVGITSDKYAAMLFPLIESCLTQDLLRIWQRSSYNSSQNGADSIRSLTADATLEIKLKNLMSFLRAEVENEQKICLASEGFGLLDNSVRSGSSVDHKKKSAKDLSTATAAGLLNACVAKCIFCAGCHSSDMCFKAQKMGYDEKKNIIAEKKACFKCLKVGHQLRKCRSRLRCVVCGQSHAPLMCQSLPSIKQESDGAKAKDAGGDQVMTNQTSKQVFLQTLRITLKGATGTRKVRALIDSGSQRSYILKTTALALGLKPKRIEKIVHCLFGGQMSTDTHYCYDVAMVNGKYTKNFEALDQPYICNEVAPIFNGPWMEEFKRLGVSISDSENSDPIELLLGADIVGSLYTGRLHKIQCGLTAMETNLGWTVMGRVSGSNIRSNETMTVLSLFANPSIADLWQLDVLGIQEPTEKKTKQEMANAAKDLFLQTVTINMEGRYEVRLPWIEGHPLLPTNHSVAESG